MVNLLLLFCVGFFTVKDQLFDLTSLVRSEMIDWVAAKQATLCGESISPMHQHIQSYRDTTGNIQVGRVFCCCHFGFCNIVRTTKIKKCFFWLSRVFRSKLTQKSMTFLHEKPVESAKAVFLAFELTAGPHSLLLYDLPAPWLFAVKMGGFWALKTPTLSEYNGKFQNAWSGWFGASSCMQEKFLCFGPSPFWSIVYSVVVVLVVLVRRITRMKHIIIP